MQARLSRDEIPDFGVRVDRRAIPHQGDRADYVGRQAAQAGRRRVASLVIRRAALAQAEPLTLGRDDQHAHQIEPVVMVQAGPDSRRLTLRC